MILFVSAVYCVCDDLPACLQFAVKSRSGWLGSLCSKSHGLLLENVTCNETTDTNFGSRSHDQAVVSFAKGGLKGGIKENRRTFEVAKHNTGIQVRADSGAHSKFQDGSGEYLLKLQ